MRTLITRVLALTGLLAVTLATGSALALANGQATAICPSGQVGLTVHWADAQDALFCAVADGLQGMPSAPTIVGLVVRGPDDAVTTIDVAPATTSTGDVQITSSRSMSTSSSTSSSTSCVNGHCTTISSHLECVDGSCSSQP